MSSKQKLFTDAHSIIYEGVGSYDSVHKDGVYKIILPASEMGTITVDSKIYNISDSTTQAILLWLQSSNNTDLSANTEIYIHEVSLDFSASNIEAYDSNSTPPDIDLNIGGEIIVVVYHNDTLHFDFVQPQKFGLGILRKR